MWKRRPYRRRFGGLKRGGFRRLGKKAEVTNVQAAYQLKATAGTHTFVSPAVWVVQLASLSSLVTDYDYTGASDPPRSMPPQWKGLSIRGGYLEVALAVTAGPTYGFANLGGNPDAWTNGYARFWVQLYKDDFIWADIGGGTYAETPDFTVVHPERHDLVPGGIHSDHLRPTRILHRSHGHLNTTATTEYSASELSYPYCYPTPGPGYATTRRFKVSKTFLDERSSLWLAVALSNPWTASEGHETDIEVGITVHGCLAYKLRTA